MRTHKNLQQIVQSINQSINKCDMFKNILEDKPSVQGNSQQNYLEALKKTFCKI